MNAVPSTKLKARAEIQGLKNKLLGGRIFAAAAVLSVLRGFGVFGASDRMFDGFEFLLFYAPVLAVVALVLLLLVIFPGVGAKDANESNAINRLKLKARVTIYVMIAAPPVVLLIAQLLD